MAVQDPFLFVIDRVRDRAAGIVGGGAEAEALCNGAAGGRVEIVIARTSGYAALGDAAIGTDCDYSPDCALGAAVGRVGRIVRVSDLAYNPFGICAGIIA